jgi:hypothetical protein
MYIHLLYLDIYKYILFTTYIQIYKKNLIIEIYV